MAKVKKEPLSVVNVKINENNEIEYVEMDEENSDGSSESQEDSDADPLLVKTGDDCWKVKKSNHTVQHVCIQCTKPFKSKRLLNKHRESCDVEVKQKTIKKAKVSAKSASAGSGSSKKKVARLCYCCDEELESAHYGHITCKYCPKSFKSHLNLEKHLFSLHSACEDFACTSCNATCPSQKVLDSHMESHKTGKPFSCQKCGKDFTRKYHLDRHLAHTGCDKNRPKVEFSCEVCGKAFSRIDNLREHLKAHMGQTMRKKDYQCQYCNKAFYGTSLLNIHIRTHTGERPFSCDLCSKAFPSNGALRKHRRMHTGEKPYECKLCPARFAAKETLNRHIKTHTGERPHVCKICGKSFIQATQLRSHMFHHTGENGFECQYCHRSFSRKQRMITHIKFVHEGEQPLICDVCKKTFMRKDDLSRHMEIHKGVKEFGCSDCEKMFSTKASLKVHLRTHLREEPCACDACDRKFIRIDCLLRHMRSKHREILKQIIDDAEKKKIKNTVLAEMAKKDGKNAGSNSSEYDEESEDGYYDEINPLDIADQEEGIELTELITGEDNFGEIKQEIDAEKIFMDDDVLKESIGKLLNLLVDEDTLANFGWPAAPVEDVLSDVIRHCGHTPADYTDCSDYTSKMRENAKLLFTVVIENDSIKALLNNHTIDEVIEHVLKLSKAKFSLGSMT